MGFPFDDSVSRDPLVRQVLRLRVGDRLPVVAVALEDQDGAPVDLTGLSAYLTLRAATPGGVDWLYRMQMVVDDPTGGRVSYSWAPGDTENAVPGEYQAIVTLEESDRGGEPVGTYGGVVLSVPSRGGGLLEVSLRPGVTAETGGFADFRIGLLSGDDDQDVGVFVGTRELPIVEDPPAMLAQVSTEALWDAYTLEVDDTSATNRRLYVAYAFEAGGVSLSQVDVNGVAATALGETFINDTVQSVWEVDEADLPPAGGGSLTITPAFAVPAGSPGCHVHVFYLANVTGPTTFVQDTLSIATPAGVAVPADITTPLADMVVLSVCNSRTLTVPSTTPIWNFYSTVVSGDEVLDSVTGSRGAYTLDGEFAGAMSIDWTFPIVASRIVTSSWCVEAAFPAPNLAP